MANVRKYTNTYEFTWWWIAPSNAHIWFCYQNWILQNKMARNSHSYRRTSKLRTRNSFVGFVYSHSTSNFRTLFLPLHPRRPSCWIVISYSLPVMQAKHFFSPFARIWFMFVENWMKLREILPRKKKHIRLAHFDSMWRCGMRKPCWKKSPQKL